MGFKLPKLTTEIDCGPIGYPGLIVTCWLNPTYLDWEPPEKPQKWDTEYYYGMARIIETLTIPADFTDSGQQVVIQVKDAKTMFDVLRTEGFDQTIVTWAIGQYQEQRQERLRVAAKN
jgi:hypothetical protein